MGAGVPGRPPSPFGTLREEEGCTRKSYKEQSWSC